MPRKKSLKNKHSGTNTLRIIGGEWRSRKLPFVDAQGLRPTPDRIRETLFNWLQGYIHGANCLDLFTGSGILGLEALSRGANQVTFVEKNKAIANQLKINLKTLKSVAEVHHQDALEYLEDVSRDYKTGKKRGGVLDIIFLDPPYRQNLLEKALKIICDKENGMVDANTLIYLEHGTKESFDWDRFGLNVLKQANAGQVKSYLMGVKGSAE